MESWPHNIWIRRIWPILAIALLWFGYRYYSAYSASHGEAQETEYALVTAKIWVASALNRHDPERYITVRDSILADYSVTGEMIKQFIRRYEDHRKDPVPFSVKVEDFIDSLIRIEDSVRALRPETPPDTTTGS